MTRVDGALQDLARHLEPALRDRLLELLDATAHVHRVLDLQERTRRAEDLAKECQRQLHIRDRQCDELRSRLCMVGVHSSGCGHWLHEHILRGGPQLPVQVEGAPPAAAEPTS